MTALTALITIRDSTMSRTVCLPRLFVATPPMVAGGGRAPGRHPAHGASGLGTVTATLIPAVDVQKGTIG
ncbi:hypothetical protein GCM10027168_23510 [Streptomyces capparidis]